MVTTFLPVVKRVVISTGWLSAIQQRLATRKSCENVFAAPSAPVTVMTTRSSVLNRPSPPGLDDRITLPAR